MKGLLHVKPSMPVHRRLQARCTGNEAGDAHGRAMHNGETRLFDYAC